MENMESSAYRLGFCHGMDRIIRAIRNMPEADIDVDFVLRVAANLATAMRNEQIDIPKFGEED